MTHWKYWAIATTLAFFGLAVPARSQTADARFNQSLRETLDIIDPAFVPIVDIVGEENNVQFARGVCTQLDDGQDVDAILAQVESNTNIATLSQEEQAILGAYFGILVVRGTETYCSEHMDKIQEFFERARS